MMRCSMMIGDGALVSYILLQLPTEPAGMRHCPISIRGDCRAGLMEAQMKRIIDIKANTVTFTFDGLHAPVVLDMARVSAGNKRYAALHGINQRVGDAAANMKTEDARHAAIVDLVAYYHTADTVDEFDETMWSVRKSATPARDANMVAMAAKLGITYEDLLARVAQSFMADLPE
jgi:hypothetical protein